VALMAKMVITCVEALYVVGAGSLCCGVMRPNEPRFSMGFEEEYLLVDRGSRDLVPEPPGTILESCEKILGDRVAPEFFQSQIEIGTSPQVKLADARAELVELRTTVAEAADREGLALIAASAHPFGHWKDQVPTDKDRYSLLAQDMAASLQKLVIGGMHIHVEIGDPDLRIDLMSQVTYFIPHLFSLSTSSPYWEGEDTGMQSYRKIVFGAMPRTGLPPQQFDTWSEYRRHVDVLTQSGIIEDATKIWWEIRPSDRYPTLEYRASDICTQVDDAVAIGAAYTCLLRNLYRRRLKNQRWRLYDNFLINENMWRSQRYSVADLSLIDLGVGELVPIRTLLEELIVMCERDAAELGVEEEMNHMLTIVDRGTSADIQRNVYAKVVAAGGSNDEGLKAVVDHLIKETVRF
jgi:carboxylate-amine ligase